MLFFKVYIFHLLLTIHLAHVRKFYTLKYVSHLKPFPLLLRAVTKDLPGANTLRLSGKEFQYRS